MSWRTSWAIPGRVVVGAVLAMLLALMPTAAFAQDSEPELDFPVFEGLTILSVDRDAVTGEVAIVALAPPELALAGHEVPGRSVRVILDGVAVPAVYEAVPADQLEVQLVVDVSGSMAGAKLAAAKDAALSFARTMPAAVQLGVVSFDDEVTVSAVLGSSIEDVANAISGLQVGGDTAMHDAVIVAIAEFGEPDDQVQRVLVLLTDGEDEGSIAPLDEVVATVGPSGADVYAVALGSNIDIETALRPIVAPTAGTLLEAQDSAELRPIYDQLAAQLASQFTMRFTPSSPDAGSVGILVDHLGVVAGATVLFDSYTPPPVPTTQPAPQIAQPTEAPPRVFADLVATTGSEGNWLTAGGARLLGIIALASTLLIAGMMISFPSQRMVRLASAGRSRVEETQLSGFNERLEGFADRALERNQRGRLIESALERAGIELRPAEFVVIAGAIAVTIGALVFLIGGPIVALLSMVISFVATRAYVSYKAKKRTALFVDQLPGTLQLLAGALRAGHALPQAAETVAREAETPTADEFHRLVTEHRLGRDFGEALDAMDARVGSEDFTWVVQAIEIHREVGGDLAEVLDNVHSTMRDRSFIRRQFKALSAEGRYSAYLIVSLPFLVCLALAIINPDYIAPLFNTPKGLLVVTIALSLIAAGGLWMRVLMKVKF